MFDHILFKSVGLPKDIPLPSRSTEKSAGYDFFTPEAFTLEPNEKILINSRVSAVFPANVGLIMRSKSGLAINKDIEVFHGLIDADYYPNPIFIQLKNNGTEPKVFPVKSKIAQGIFIPLLFTTDDAATSVKRTSGLGSTGQ